MLISEKHKAIFIANPKTATTAVSKCLTSKDDSWCVNRFKKGEHTIKFQEHDYPTAIMKLIPSEYIQYKKFVFVRSPYEKAVSAYFFYKNGNPLTYGSVWNYRKKFKNFFRALLTYFHMLIAKILPFQLWSLVRTIKTNQRYLLNEKGVFIVNYIGLTEQLENDLKCILQNFGIDEVDNVNIHKINTSSHKPYNEYFKGRLHKVLFEKKYNQEIQLFKTLKQKGAGFDFEGLSVNDVLKSV